MDNKQGVSGKGERIERAERRRAGQDSWQLKKGGVQSSQVPLQSSNEELW